MKYLSAELINDFEGHEGAIYTIEPGKDSHLFFSGGADRMVVLWDLLEGGPVRVVAQLPAVIYAIKYIPFYNLLIVGEAAGGIHIIDLRKWQVVKRWKYHRDAIHDIGYHAETGSFYALTAGGDVSMWHLSDLAHIKTLHLCDGKIRDIDFNNETNEMALACGDNTIRILDFKKFKAKLAIRKHTRGVNTVRFHPNGKMLISGGQDAHLNGYDVENNFLPGFRIPAHNYGIYDVKFNPAGTLLASCSQDKTVKIWDPFQPKLLKVIDHARDNGHQFSVNNLLWTDHKDILISAGDDRKIKTWSIKKTGDWT